MRLELRNLMLLLLLLLLRNLLWRSLGLLRYGGWFRRAFGRQP